MSDPLRINADFSQAVASHDSERRFAPSPSAGVWRQPLDRIGDEVARATTIVRYDAGSAFPSHTHALGEEFLVLSGVFSDAEGDYGPLTYVRNPPGSAHAPKSADGCEIFVKLRQFDVEDLTRVVTDASKAEWWSPREGEVTSVLHGYESTVDGYAERVLFHRWENAFSGPLLNRGETRRGTELLLLEGRVRVESEALSKPVTATPRTWVRLPPGAVAHVVVEEAALAWVKKGHLSPRRPVDVSPP